MIDKIISKYLEDNRRLVVPQLGAFLVKGEDHIVLFSELLTRDDGVLLHLLMAEGLSQLEAEGLISRLRFDVRYLLENGGQYDLPSLGTFSCTDKGTLHFEYHPSQQEIEIEEVAGIEPEPIVEEEEPLQQELPVEEIVEEVVEEQPQPEEFVAPKEAVTETPKATQKVEVPKYERFEPDPDLEGLSYGDRRRGSRSSRNGGAGKNVDWWMVAAIASVVLAVSVILYGFLREGARNSSPLAHYEQIVEE